MKTFYTGRSRLHTEILLLFALAALSALLLRPLQKNLFERMDRLRNLALARAEAFLGRSISWDSISPSFFNTIDVRGIKVQGKDGTPVMAVRRLRLSYSLADLVRGNADPVSSVRAVRIDSPIADIDVERDKDLLALFRQPAGAGGLDDAKALLARLGEDVLLSVRRGQAVFRAGGNSFHAGEIAFDAAKRNSRIVTKLKWRAGAELTDSSLPKDVLDALSGLGIGGGPFAAEMNGKLKASAAEDLSAAEGSVFVSAASVSSAGKRFVRIKPLGFDVSFADGKLNAAKHDDGNPFALTAAYGIKTGNLSAALNSGGLLPGDLIALDGPLQPYQKHLGTEIRGTASFAAVLRHEEASPGVSVSGLAYDADMTFSLPGRETVILKAGGDAEKVRVANAEVRLAKGAAAFRGEIGFNPFAPNGTLAIDELSFGGSGTIDADFTVSTFGKEISLFAETARAGKVDLTAPDFRFFPDGNGVSFALSAFRFTGTESYGGEVGMGRLSLDGSVDFNPRRLEASFYLDSFGIGDLAAMASPAADLPTLPDFAADILNGISVTTEVFVTTDFAHVLYNAPRFALAYRGSVDTVALFSVSGSDRRFSLDGGQIVWPGGALELRADADFSRPEDITFLLQTTWQNLSYYFEGTVMDRNSLSLRGSYGLDAHVTETDGAYSGYVQGQQFPLFVRGQTAEMDLSAGFRYRNAEEWSVSLDRCSITGLRTASSPAARINVSGNADQNGAVFPNLVFDDGRGLLSGSAAWNWFDGYKNLRFSAALADVSGKESAGIHGSWQDKTLNLDVQAKSFQLSRIVEKAYDGLLDGDLTLRWNSVDSFDLATDIHSLSFRIQDTPFSVSGRAAADPASFTLKNVSANYGSFAAQISSLLVEPRKGTAAGDIAVQGAAAGKSFETAFAVQSNFTPVESWLDAGNAVKDLGGAVSVASFRFDTIQSWETFAFTFARKQQGTGYSFSLNGGPGDFLRFNIDNKGDFFLGLSKPSPIRGMAAGNIKNGMIDARLPHFYVDLPGLWHFVPREVEMSLPGGYATGELTIRGPLGDPEFSGKARGNSVQIRVPPFIPEAIKAVPFDIAVTNSEITFGPVAAAVGRGGGTVKGWFRFDRWIPNIFSLDIAVPRTTPIPFRFDIMGFLAHGNAAGALNLSMEDLIFKVAGDLTAEDAEISLNTDEITAAGASDPYANMVIPIVTDLNVTTGNKVEFVWPNTDIPILHAYADQGTPVKVTSDTTARRFSINSDVKLRSGEIFYFERSFYIRSGSLNFRESELQFDPRITARAEIRDQTNEGPVTISLIVDDAPLMSFTPRLESSPPLSQMDIFALLGQNLTGTDVNDQTGSVQRAFLNSSADVLAQFQVVRSLERRTRDLLHLDMFSVRTQILQNAVFDAAGLRTPVDTNAGVGNYFDNTTVFLGKYIGRRIFAQSMFSLRYDRYNTVGEEDEGIRLGEHLRLEPDISLELDGPIFDIRWDFVPLHPENLFVDDNSFSLIWRYSF